MPHSSHFTRLVLDGKGMPSDSPEAEKGAWQTLIMLSALEVSHSVRLHFPNQARSYKSVTGESCLLVWYCFQNWHIINTLPGASSPWDVSNCYRERQRKGERRKPSGLNKNEDSRRDKLGVWNEQIQTSIYKTDKQGQRTIFNILKYTIMKKNIYIYR